MTSAQARFIACCTLTILVTVSGCGGGGGDSTLDLTGNGSISSNDMYVGDGYYVDAVGFTATRNGSIEVRMWRSGGDPLDPQLLVCGGDAPFGSYWVIGGSDDSGGTLDSRYVFTATEDQRYTAVFSTFAAGDWGTYSWSIREVSGAAASSTETPPADKQGGKDLAVVIGHR